MNYPLLGRTGLRVACFSVGASSLSAAFHVVDEPEAIKAVPTALDLGITYFNIAPAYGGSQPETTLGRTLKGILRSRFSLSTQVGTYTNPAYGTRLGCLCSMMP
jgi:aryl-alcohol dehydrogenase-like predicted oxidoreductase